MSSPDSSVLIVDDDPDMRFLARTVLEMAGFTVADEAVDGIDALAKFESLDPPPIPTIVLLDSQMPGLTGLEVAERILHDLPEQLIVLFSAFLDETITRRAGALGVARCVPKGDAMELPDLMTELIAAGA